MSDITASGIDETIAHLSGMAVRAEEAQRQVVTALGDRWLVQLKDETPIGKGETSGNLAGAYQTEEHYGATGAEYRITNTTPYLRYVLKGRGAITAINGKMLRFVIGGQVFFRRSVGPAKANPFAARVADRMRADVAQAGQQIANLIVRS
jgi:hypothetical protein